MAPLIPFLLIALIAVAADLPSRKYLNLAAIKTMVAAAETEMQKHNVLVTICIVDESGNLLFLQKADGVALTTIQFAQRKARQAALYRKPSKSAQDALAGGNGRVGVPRFVPQPGRGSDYRRRTDYRRHRLQRSAVGGG